MPAIELLYLWNLFNVFGKRKSLCDNLYRLIDKNTKDLEKNPGIILLSYNSRTVKRTVKLYPYILSSSI